MVEARGVLVGIKVVIVDPEQARKIFSKGYYGKPVGIRKPRSPDFNAPLELSLIEAFYLVEKGILEVEDAKGSKVGFKELRDYAMKHIPRCEPLYMVYRDLREKGFVVRSGLKFGADYAVYEFGPGIDHAPYLVHVMPLEEKIDPIEIVRAGRLSHSVRKSFIIAAVNPRQNKIKYVMFKWFKP
ncbi:MAG: tRNA-intron lyase [Thermoprotei archaeon]|nr:MAG: tRNA-intron lyase [Thermoprotei archaeon]